MEFVVFLQILCVIVSLSTAFSGDDYEEDNWDSRFSRQEACVPQPLGGVDWILSVQQADHGWREETHRAVIALVVSDDWKHRVSAEDVRQAELQLEVELTKALLRNTTSAMHPNDLALYIHALIAIKRNPHDFYGINLVEKLQVITKVHQIHPFLLLALCNGGALAPVSMPFDDWLRVNQLSSSKLTPEYLAMSLNAYECLKADTYEADDVYKRNVMKDLISRQHSDGSFGNVYTTSLIVQALASYRSWDNQSALDYLSRQSIVDVNMVSTYLIQLALNVGRIRFIKDLAPRIGRVVEKFDKAHYVQYTIRIGERADVYHTLTMKVSEDSSFFDIMTLGAKHDPKFNFSSYLDKEGLPAIYSVSDVPNDAEENLYWRVCLQTDIDHNRHTSSLRTIDGSPVKFVPQKESHIILWYLPHECEEKA